MEDSFRWFVGIDASMADYQICLLDTIGQVISERKVAHSGSGISEFLDWLAKQTTKPGRWRWRSEPRAVP